MILETERLILRDWQEEDIDELIALKGDSQVMKHFPGTDSKEKVRENFIKSRSNSAKHGYWYWPVILCETNEFLGFCGIAETGYETPFGPITEIGWSLNARFWGKGYTTEAARAWLGHAFDILDKPEVVSFTTNNNLPSLSVMKKLGMKRDAAKDFDHPRVSAKTHPHLVRHVVYSMTNKEWRKQTQ
ncbi:MAG: GNAT family N-acetyltransferase [Hyphomicrobiales bacterium]|nr:MAG: GNAT family N-acetyltransferase [Hyphomicrobiales bacterium]